MLESLRLTLMEYPSKEFGKDPLEHIFKAKCTKLKIGSKILTIIDFYDIFLVTDY